MQAIYDLEVYPNCFLCGIKPLGQSPVIFEISERRNDIAPLCTALNQLTLMIGFNNIGYDYPVLHHTMMTAAREPITAAVPYWKSQRIFAAQDNERFAEQVHWRDIIIPQLDLFLIHHMDNKARRTSLKALQFNMRSESIEDLPIAPGTQLTHGQMDELRAYNLHDLSETEKFYYHSKPAIDFRAALGDKFRNYNDTKIGKQYFIKALEEKQRGSCYYSDGGPKQTWRDKIAFKDIILPCVRFEHPNLSSTLRFLEQQVITSTKNAFDDFPLTHINGFKFEFGTGGIHGSVKNRIVSVDADDMILDLDVTSYYPSIAIVNRLHPEHLGTAFCDVYADLKQQRISHPKNSPENKALKLALNGVYGDSNNKYSPFYDPQYTMSITVNGQLLLCMLAEQLMLKVPGLEMIQINTDGMTVKFPRRWRQQVQAVCDWWTTNTRLDLEDVEYSRMWIRDVNNYIAEKLDGKLKRKGTYEYDMANHPWGWSTNHSQFIVAKAAEAELVHGHKLADYITEQAATGDVFDFMILGRAPSNSRMQLSDGTPLNRTNRYYVSTAGHELIKIMPPLAKPGAKERHISVQKGRKVTLCNRVSPGFKLHNLDVDYYVKEARKLTGDLKL